MSSLSVARSISLDANLLSYLESLATRAYFVVYGVRDRFGALVRQFIQRDFPAAVRATSGPIFLAFLLLVAGIWTGWAVTAADSEWFEAFISSEMASGRTPYASREQLESYLFAAGQQGAAEAFLGFAAMLFDNNARVGILCFALGALFGAPVVLLMFANGLPAGALFAVHAKQGLTVEFLGWLSIHGTTELLAVFLCAGAGFHLGGAMLWPGRRTRLRALADHGRRAAVLLVGAVAMLVVAALLEGFARQLITSTSIRLGIGILVLAAWLGYFFFCGRGLRSGAPERTTALHKGPAGNRRQGP
jgi:uncharacterized membrane protein SpoIIM required for sporulation